MTDKCETANAADLARLNQAEIQGADIAQQPVDPRQAELLAASKAREILQQQALQFVHSYQHAALGHGIDPALSGVFLVTTHSTGSCGLQGSTTPGLPPTQLVEAAMALVDVSLGMLGADDRHERSALHRAKEALRTVHHLRTGSFFLAQTRH